MADQEKIRYDEDETGEDFSNKVCRVATSFAMLVAAFITSNLVLQILIAVFSRALKYAVKFSYNEVTVTPWDYHYWNRTNVALTSLLPPVICLVLGMVIFGFLHKYSDWAGRLRIFFFWLSASLVNMVLTHILIAPLGTPLNLNNGLYQTFAVIAAWFYIDPQLMVMASLASLISSLGVGILLRKEVMRYSYSKKLIRVKAGMDSMVLQVYVFPLMLAILPVMLLCTRAGFLTNIMEFANLAVMSIGIFIMNSVGGAKVRCNRKDVLNHIPAVELAVSAAVWLLVFFLLR